MTLEKQSAKQQLYDFVQEHNNVQLHEDVKNLVNSLQDRFQSSLQAVLFYGSCLRKNDLNGLLDLHVLVDSYWCHGCKWWESLFNTLVPPNVYYLQLSLPDRIIRAKYALYPLKTFLNASSGQWFQTYIWARFAQPASILYARDEIIKDQVLWGQVNAILTFLTRTMPIVDPGSTGWQIWQKALTASYKTELRPESSETINRMVLENKDYYDQVTSMAGSLLPYQVILQDPPGALVFKIPCPVRLKSKLAWKIRKIQGKMLSFLRLSKAFFTFDGGLDYLAWKIERHSGLKVEIKAKDRKHPFLTAVLMSIRLFRRGAFK